MSRRTPRRQGASVSRRTSQHGNAGRTRAGSRASRNASRKNGGGRRHATKQRAYTTSESRILDFLATIPAMIVILITLREIFLAVTNSAMGKEQYTKFPELFQFGNFIIIIVGIL